MKTRHRNTLIGGAAALAVAVATIGFMQNRAQAQPQATAKAVLSVNVVKPQTQVWPKTLAANGTIVAWHEAIIAAETGGLRIMALHVDTGSQVKRGQLLAELAHDAVQADVQRYEATLASARASLGQAKANADRARQVKGSGALSEQQIHEYLATEQTAQAAVAVAEAQLAAQKVTLAQTRITAIDDGLITARSVVLGQVVSSGTELFRLQRQNRLEWQAEVDAQQLAQIKAGAKAEVTLPSGQILQGSVRLVAPTISTSTSRANVFVALPAGATAGIFASGQIEAGQQKVLALPQAAIVLRDGLSYVYEVGTDHKVIRHRISSGARRNGLVDISGVNPNATIVAAGGAFLADGDLVNIAKDAK